MACHLMMRTSCKQAIRVAFFRQASALEAHSLKLDSSIEKFVYNGSGLDLREAERRHHPIERYIVEHHNLPVVVGTHPGL